MYRSLMLITLYLSALAAAVPNPPSNHPDNQPANPLANQQVLPPARLATRNLHDNCRNIRIENPRPPLQNIDTANNQPTYATELTASPESEHNSDASTLRGSERRANLPQQPKPLLVGNCKKRDGQTRETKLSLDYCLGWREENGGTLIAESSGFGMQKGQCRNCHYYKYAWGDLDFKIICSCANASDRRERAFKTSGVITYDNESGRIRCHNNPGS
ncbi:hypothetical protein RU639_007573 [Aspergillus parasiticus]